MKLNDIYSKTSGGKTITATVIWLTMRIANGIKPDLIPMETQLIVYDVAELLALLGITDKIYKNRKQIVSYIKNLFTKN